MFFNDFSVKFFAFVFSVLCHPYMLFTFLKLFYIYVCVTLRNAIILRTAHGVAGPFVAQFSRATSTRVG